MIRSLLCFLLLPAMVVAQAAEPIGRVVWSENQSSFGGFSGIEMLSDDRFIAISDRGHFAIGNLVHGDGSLKDVTLEQWAEILTSKGSTLDPKDRDAEGIAIGPDGTIYVSFESNSRIMSHADIFSAAEFVPKHPDFRRLQNNSGLEALAIDASGRLHTIPERSGKLDRPFPVYRFDGSEWNVIFQIPRSRSYLVVGADFGPDGYFYVLERGFSWLTGFSMRVRRFDLSNPNDGETIVEKSGGLENAEGISVWRHSDSSIRMVLISDDNFNAMQSTVVTEYQIVD